MQVVAVVHIGVLLVGEVEVHMEEMGEMEVYMQMLQMEKTAKAKLFLIEALEDMVGNIILVLVVMVVFGEVAVVVAEQ